MPFYGNGTQILHRRETPRDGAVPTAYAPWSTRLPGSPVFLSRGYTDTTFAQIIDIPLIDDGTDVLSPDALVKDQFSLLPLIDSGAVFGPIKADLST